MTKSKLILIAGVALSVAACSRQAENGNAVAETSTTTTTATGNSPAPAATRVRGVLRQIAGDTLTVQGYDGQPTTVPTDAKTAFAWVVASSLSTLKDGDFIGTATTGPDDALRAVELVIFPASMRGQGEGHYPWDTPGVVASKGGNAGGSSAMTNGTVQQQSAMTNGTVTQRSAMTNGTVTQQSAMTNGTVQQQSAMTNGTVTGGAGGTTLTISYKGGTSIVAVPPGTPVVRFEPTQRSSLAIGQKLFAVVPSGATAAKFVAVGRDGLTPPM